MFMQLGVRESCFLLFLAIQLIPIVRFYSHSLDAQQHWSFESLDERFSWRMFSPLSRTLECRFEFLNDQRQRIDLATLYQKAWLDNLALCRHSVANSIVYDLCRKTNTSLIERKVSIRLKISSFKVFLYSLVRFSPLTTRDLIRYTRGGG